MFRLRAFLGLIGVIKPWLWAILQSSERVMNAGVPQPIKGVGAPLCTTHKNSGGPQDLSAKLAGYIFKLSRPLPKMHSMVEQKKFPFKGAVYFILLHYTNTVASGVFVLVSLQSA